MKNWWIFVCIILIAAGCKKAFFPKEINSDSSHYLVIEGVINSGNDSTIIKLSRTRKIDTLRTIDPETAANVTVESDANNAYPLNEITLGTYASAPLHLDDSHKYRLRIKTSNQKEYVSDFVPVKNAPPIDSLGFVAQSDGVHIYINSHDPADATRYYRWDYDETWQFHSKYVSTYKSNKVDSLLARRVDEQVYNCFGSDASSMVVIANSNKLVHDIIYQAPIINIPSTSEKIETKYSILVKQYALTADAYTFWEDLQKNTEKIGNIFDALPSVNESNFHCVTNPGELVIGYLSVGSSSSKRIFISADQLLPGYSPVYPCECTLDTAFVNPPHGGTRPISDLIPANSPFTPVSALYLPPLNPFGLPTAYSYSTILCVDCTVRGTTTRPSFWK